MTEWKLEQLQGSDKGEACPRGSYGRAEPSGRARDLLYEKDRGLARETYLTGAHVCDRRTRWRGICRSMERRSGPPRPTLSRRCGRPFLPLRAPVQMWDPIPSPACYLICGLQLALLPTVNHELF